jgi:uncharacterized protein
MKIEPIKADTPASRMLAWLARMVMRRRPLWVLGHGIAFVLAVLYTVNFLEFSTSRDDLVGASKTYHQNFLQFKREFPTQDDLVVIVESDNPEKNRQFVERLGARLDRETNLFNNIFYKGDLQMLGNKALLFVPENDLEELRNRLKEYLPFIKSFSQTTNLVSLFDMINAQFRTARRQTDAQTESMIEALPALERILIQANDSLRRTGVPPSPGLTALFDADPNAEQQLYITFAGGRIFLVSAQAPVAELNAPAVNRLRILVEETRAEVPGVNVGITGEPVLENDEMEQSQKDTMRASIVALLLCSLIFIYGYQETGRPIKATVCLIIGVATPWPLPRLPLAISTF